MLLAKGSLFSKAKAESALVATSTRKPASRRTVSRTRSCSALSSISSTRLPDNDPPEFASSLVRSAAIAARSLAGASYAVPGHGLQPRPAASRPARNRPEILALRTVHRREPESSPPVHPSAGNWRSWDGPHWPVSPPFWKLICLRNVYVLLSPCHNSYTSS